MDWVDDRGSTDDWLLPEDRAPQAIGPSPESIERQVSEALTVARASARIAAEAEVTAKLAGDDAAACTAELTELADRVEAALGHLEARERAASRRAAEAEREEKTLRRFDERADRIVQRLRDLERSPAVLTVTVPATASR